MNIQKEIKCLEFEIEIREAAKKRARSTVIMSAIPWGFLAFVNIPLGILGVSLQIAGLIRQFWIYYQAEQTIKEFKAEISNV